MKHFLVSVTISAHFFVCVDLIMVKIELFRNCAETQLRKLCVKETLRTISRDLYDLVRDSTSFMFVRNYECYNRHNTQTEETVKTYSWRRLYLRVGCNEWSVVRAVNTMTHSERSAPPNQMFPTACIIICHTNEMIALNCVVYWQNGTTHRWSLPWYTYSIDKTEICRKRRRRRGGEKTNGNRVFVRKLMTRKSPVNEDTNKINTAPFTNNNASRKNDVHM